ncbi:MAG TPA: hypothetical protein VGP70_13280 [Actinomadura sp.]|nr:hypothetical protein [Actinomadura sp.]
MSTLASLAAAVEERPTLEQVDAMLVALLRMPRDEAVAGLIDDLLDYRAMAVSAPPPG